jgi:hypothetical protein
VEIKKLNFEKKEVQIKETYIDETGKTRERIKTVMMPTGISSLPTILILHRLKRRKTNQAHQKMLDKKNGAKAR